MFTWLAISAILIAAAVLLVRANIRARAGRKASSAPEPLPPEVAPLAGQVPPPAGQTRPRPRQRLARFDLGCMLLFGLIWTGVSLFGAIFSILMLVEEGRIYAVLRDRGQATEAAITRRRLVPDSEGDRYYVTYQYTAPLPQGDRQQFEREEQVREEAYEAMPPETRVTVLYDPANPGTARLQAGLGPPFFELFMSCFLGLFLLVGLALLAWGGAALRETVSLALGGRTTGGLLTDRWVERDSEDTSYCVAYRFQAPQADGLTRQVDRAEYNYTAYRTYEVGDPVQVRYYRANPDICRLEL